MTPKAEPEEEWKHIRGRCCCQGLVVGEKSQSHLPFAPSRRWWKHSRWNGDWASGPGSAEGSDTGRGGNHPFSTAQSGRDFPLYIRTAGVAHKKSASLETSYHLNSRKPLSSSLGNKARSVTTKNNWIGSGTRQESLLSALGGLH